MTFAEALHLSPRSAGESTWQVPDGWQQGRGAFGGLTLAALAKAASATLSSADRPLRTITAEIPAAVVVGPARIRVTPLRAGNSLSAVAAQIVQGDDVAAHAVLNFGKTRDVGFDRGPAAPAFPSYAASSVGSLGSLAPAFAQHFEHRIVRGYPLSGGEAIAEGWVRLLEPGDVPSPIALLAMIDAWFPSVFPALTEPRPFATISFAAHLFDRGWLPHQPLFHRSRLIASQQGYFAEVRELFDERGELCAINQQTMAIIK